MSKATNSLTELAKAKSLLPLWEVFHNIVLEEPVPGCETAHWSYADVQQLLRRAAKEVSTEDAERRVLLFKNPGLEQPFATHTLAAGMQILLEGEVEGSHRHTQAALRLVVEGEGGYTTTNGERIWMSPGDVITTPSWCWHDHGKPTQGDLIWLDGIDVPLVNFMKLTFSEFMVEGDRRQPLTRADADSHFRFGSGLAPLEGLPVSRHSPIYAYPYERTRDVLENLKRNDDWDKCHGIKLKLAHPGTGGHVMPTIACAMQLLPKGFSTEMYRATDAQIVSIVEGAGTTTIGAEQIAWVKGDVFVIPNWTYYSTSAAEESVLFSFSDRAAQENLGLWREQRQPHVR